MLTSDQAVRPTSRLISHDALGKGASCLITVAHQGPAAVLGAQEPVHQHGPSKGEVELDVLLKVSAQLVTVQVIAEGEALARDQHVYLTPHRHRKQGLQAICQGHKQGERVHQLRPVPHQGPAPGTESTPAARDAAALCRNHTQMVTSPNLTGVMPKSQLVYCPTWQPKFLQNEFRTPEPEGSESNHYQR